MPWRVISTEEGVWHVQPAAERRPDAKLWQLVLAFRAVNSEAKPRSFWASYPIESASKSAVFAQAERISYEALRQVLAKHVR
jgi:hypothetical protein